MTTFTGCTADTRDFARRDSRPASRPPSSLGTNFLTTRAGVRLTGIGALRRLQDSQSSMSTTPPDSQHDVISSGAGLAAAVVAESGTELGEIQQVRARGYWEQV